jgi:polyhydroxybutyrate depolymerase
MARVLITGLLMLLLGCEEPIPEPVPPPPPPTEPPSDAELLAARPYSVNVPAGYDAGVEWPLLVALHGYDGSPEETVSYFDLDRLAERRGLFLIAPSGSKDARGNRSWDPGPSNYPEWDRSWLTAVIRDVKSKYRIDAARVIVFGHSQGAHMAHRMGCDSSEDVTAVISVAGQVTRVKSLCVPSRPVSVLQIHGTADAVIGYYGDVQRTPPDPAIPSAHDTVATWARVDGCTGELAPIVSSPIDVSFDGDTQEETVVELYAGCPTGIDVGLWTMNGVGHRPAPKDDFSARAVGFGLSRPRP